jgi:hypothetical protein
VAVGIRDLRQRQVQQRDVVGMSSPGSSRVTLAEVGRRYGVSPMTVSYG